MGVEILSDFRSFIFSLVFSFPARDQAEVTTYDSREKRELDGGAPFAVLARRVVTSSMTFRDMLRERLDHDKNLLRT
jgi:hypothetical protein